jgi:diguanylate cyclase
MKSSSRSLCDLIADCRAICQNPTSRVQFAKDICDILVKSGKYSAVWIGFADNDSAKTVVPIACSGHAEKYLASIKISWDENQDFGKGPGGRALREGKTQVVTNILDNIDFMHPWWEAAMKNGLLSLAVFPFTTPSKEKAVIAIYASQFYAFPEEDIPALEELALIVGRNHP